MNQSGKEERQSPRFSVDCDLTFFGENVEGEGTVVNASAGGWKVKGDRTVPKGHYLTLRIYLPGQDAPIKVDLAAVRWSYGREFGLEFLRMSPEEQDRFRAFLRTLNPAEPTTAEPFSVPSPQYAC